MYEESPLGCFPIDIQNIILNLSEDDLKCQQSRCWYGSGAGALLEGWAIKLHGVLLCDFFPSTFSFCDFAGFDPHSSQPSFFRHLSF